ncbi:MAG: RidA family protein [Candidatus Omnitrophica bacterium]|nr:RidA family protein [Candidatus Omnitrophota bacterium]
MKKIETDLAPAAIGPYSQAVIANGFVFVSGQLGSDPKTGELVSEEIRAQTEQAIKNISGILQTAGSNLELVAKTTVYLKQMEDFAAMNEIYGRYFTSQPARATVAVASLPKDALVEIECLALAASK